MNIIVRLIHGSHLYGTNTIKSDKDYCGVFLPTKEQILLNKIPKTINKNIKISKGIKNSKEDIDEELYSLHYFIKLACEGQTKVLDMLHAPRNMILEKNSIWDRIVANRDKFYTKNLKAFIGYARRQASKYGIKGSRLNAVKTVIDFLESVNSINELIKLSTVWSSLPTGEHLYHIETNDNGVRQYQVCGKILQETVTIDYALSICQRFYDSYGARAQLAKENKGIDWKAISHAIRAALQVEELLKDNTITFPLKEAVFLRDVKEGKLDYINVVSPYLEELMERVEILSKESTLPDKPNFKFWDKFIIQTIEGCIL